MTNSDYLASNQGRATLAANAVDTCIESQSNSCAQADPTICGMAQASLNAIASARGKPVRSLPQLH